MFSRGIVLAAGVLLSFEAGDAKVAFAQVRPVTPFIGAPRLPVVQIPRLDTKLGGSMPMQQMPRLDTPLAGANETPRTLPPLAPESIRLAHNPYP